MLYARWIDRTRCAATAVMFAVLIGTTARPVPGACDPAVANDVSGNRAVGDPVTRANASVMDWTWEHWWEANHDSYVYEIANARFDNPLSEKAAKAVRTVLQRATAAQDDATRGAAVLALASTGAAQDANVFARLLANDETWQVRESAALALGIHGSDQAQRLLATAHRNSAPAAPGNTIRPRLRNSEGNVDLQFVDGRAVHDQRIFQIVRTAHNLNTGEYDPQLRGEIWRNMDVAIAGLMTDRGLDKRHAATILRALTYDVVDRGGVDNVNIFAPLERLNTAQSVRVRKRNAGHPMMYLANMLPDSAAETWSVRHFGDLYISRQRASAAMAAVETGEPLLRRAVIQMLYQQRFEGNRLAQSFAIMALAQKPDEDILPVMMNLLATGDATGERKYRSESLRGFAALALGLYAKADSDRPGHEKAMTLLAERLADPREPESLRSACAVALGLTGRDAMLDPLRRIAAHVHTREQHLTGHIFLARGMLGDENIIASAAAFLTPKYLVTSVEHIAARRAAALGVGLVGRGGAADALVNAWSRDHDLNRQLVYALTLFNPDNAAELLIRQGLAAEHARDQAAIVGMMGMVYHHDNPSPLHRLTRNVNYTQWDGRLDVQRIAKPFLYERLIPAMNGRWW